VDPNIEILNQIDANSGKVEALHATITSILNEMQAGGTFVESTPRVSIKTLEWSLNIRWHQPVPVNTTPMIEDLLASPL
jgi:hypothetical protein